MKNIKDVAVLTQARLSSQRIPEKCVGFFAGAQSHARGAAGRHLDRRHADGAVAAGRQRGPRACSATASRPSAPGSPGSSSPPEPTGGHATEARRPYTLTAGVGSKHPWGAERDPHCVGKRNRPHR